MYRWTELTDEELDSILESEFLNMMREEDFEEYLKFLANKKERA